MLLRMDHDSLFFEVRLNRAGQRGIRKTRPDVGAAFDQGDPHAALRQ